MTPEQKQRVEEIQQDLALDVYSFACGKDIRKLLSIIDEQEKALAEHLRLAQMLRDIDWCIGYEFTSDQHQELYEARTLAFILQPKDQP